MKLGWIVIVGLSLSPVCARAEPVALEILDYSCARAIADRMPVETIDCSTFELPGPVYLWVRLRGGADALAMLERGDDIVIRHKWIRYVGPNPLIETTEAEEDIPAGSIDAALLTKLRREVESRGYFDWRTWTYKKRVRPTLYQVNVLDPAFAAIPCRAADGTAAQCDLSVTLRGR